MVKISERTIHFNPSLPVSAALADVRRLGERGGGRAGAGGWTRLRAREGRGVLGFSSSRPGLPASRPASRPLVASASRLRGWNLRF